MKVWKMGGWKWARYLTYKWSKKEPTPEEQSEMAKLNLLADDYKFPCKECLVQSSCDFSKPCNQLEMDDNKVKELFLKYECCPDCGSEKFHEGPCGGLAQNVECGGCGHWYNLGLPIFIQRIHVPPELAGAA